MKKKVEKYESEWKHSLDDEQSIQLSIQLAKIMKIIDEDYDGELQKIFSEADQNKCEQLKKEWNQDKVDHLHFWEDQAGNGKLIAGLYIAIVVMP